MDSPLTCPGLSFSPYTLKLQNQLMQITNLVNKIKITGEGHYIRTAQFIIKQSNGTLQLRDHFPCPTRVDTHRP
jgi:hypothetical protein